LFLAGLLLAAWRSSVGRWLRSKVRGKPRVANVEDPATPPAQT
jgi:hypothetical protein